MGNTGSNPNSENEDEETPKEAVENTEKDNSEFDGTLDLTSLFDPKQLRIVADKTKEDSAVNPLQQHHSALVRWLEERRARGAETVTLGQFVESFTNKGVSKQTATEIFQQFDIEGDGVVDLDYLHEMMDLVTRCISGFIGIRCDLPAVNKLLQDCCLAPGFIDAFTSSYFKTAQINHGQKLFKFLFRNRALSDSLQLPALKSFITTTNMRLKVLRTHLSAMKERDDKNKREPSLQSDEVLKPINRCFTSADVSSNRMDASKLVDNDNGTYWQSDGPARSHWVRLKIPQNVLIKQLSMYVVSLDQSYMPHHVVIYGGRDESNLTEINDVFIPNHITGDFTLLENVKVPYQVIQISIKRCHSDGCDTRIRQIKAIGYRVVKSKGVSVVDATAMWYLSVLAATAQAALPVAPDLRNSIINHTKISLSHMGPLSLSSSSTEKPGFLSTNVMEQMETFLQTIISMNGPPPAEDLIVLLEFAFARGSLGSILDVMKLLLDQVKEEYPAVPLLLSLSETEDKAVRRHGQKLSSVILSCDGGSRDSSTSPQLVLSENWKTETYFTADGKTKCNIAFGLKSGNLFQLTHVFMKLAKGPIAPRAGMVFVFDSDNIKDENGAALFQPLAQFDNWTEEDYNKFRENSRLEKESNPINPVAYFTVDKDWADVDISVDRIQVGSCVTIKFLGPRQETAERLGITGINLFGYELNEDIVTQQNNLEKQSQLILDDEDAYICGENVLLQTLKFLQIMSRDAVNMKTQGSKETTQEKDTTIDIYDVSMEQIWNVYTLLGESELKNEQLTLASEMVLNLFHMALPYLKPSAQKTRENRRIQQRIKKSNRENQEREYNQFSSDVFQALCDIVDRESPGEGVHKYAKAIILDGAELFFPDAKTRRDHLLSLVDKVMEDGKAVSLAYTFESLCRFFSNKDASGLLGLPDSLPQESFQPESVVHVMKTLVSVAYRESLAQVKQDAGSEVPSNLVLLLCAMQRSLLTWCHTQCSIPAAKGTAFEILVQYVEMLGEKCNCILLKLEDSEDMIKITDRLEYSFVSMAMRQLVLFLNLFSSMEIDFIAIIRHLQSLAYTLAKQTSLMPPLFSKGIMDEESAKNLENTILREWEMESEHDYENNIHVTKVFNCTGCTRFRVEFDSKCKTERKFDYLEFTDSSGCKRRFDVAVGTDIWPSTVEFNAGQRLHFLFHSDGSNTDWGYKFKVFAIGSPDVAVNWLYDLQLNLARCFGMFCGNALNSQTALSIKKSCDKDEEQALLHNELWSSLFRGGYMVGKLERSLSGFHKSSPFDSNANAFLCEIAANESERAKNVIEKCSAAYTGQRIGTGALFDSAVYAVFAALLWHTQELREEVTKLTDEEVIGEIPQSIIYAFSVAENVRRPLLEVRQRLLVQLDDCKSDNAANNDTCNPDTPIISCREKALFLLKFAGLSKLKPRKVSTHSGMERRNSALNRPRSATTTSSSYPSFQMIIDFVTNESLSHLKIQDLLQHRCKYAKTVTNIFTFSFEYMNQMMLEDTIQIPVVLFLQNMLASQDYFPQHYADYLNGCGLSLEKMVRKSYYSFIRKLTSVVRDNSNTLTPLFRCTLAYLLHFLDIEWKPYDYEFLAEMQIPYLLVTSMQGMTSLINDGGDAELTMLQRHKRFFKEATEEGIDKWCEQNRGKAPLHVQRDINLFIARYSSDLEVVITCDGCTEKIRGGRYRCLNCIDMDLCSSCYMNGMKPNEHSANHKIIHLKYTCDSCEAFIIETRIHCNSCNDFDLCLHCHKNDIYPTYHNPTHSVTKYKLIPQGLTPVKSSEMVALKTYVQQHSWLQFSAIGLSLSESLQNKTVEGIELEYMRAGGNLLLDCLEKTACCLTSSEFTLGSMGKPNSTCCRESSTFSKVKFESIEKVMTITAPSEVNFDAGKISGCDVADVMTLKVQDSTDTLSSPSSEITEVKAKDLIPLQKDDNSYFALETDNGEDDDDTLPALEGDQDEVDGAQCKGEIVTNIDTMSSHDMKDALPAATTKKVSQRNSAVDSSKMFMHLINYVQRCSRTSTDSNATQSTYVDHTSSTISTGNSSTDGGESTSAEDVTASGSSTENATSSKTSSENVISSETSAENTTSSETSAENVTSSESSSENVTTSESSSGSVTGTSSESVTGTSPESTTTSSDSTSGTSSEQVTGTSSTESGTTGTSSVESSSSESSSNESSSATGTSTESSTTTTTDSSSSEDSNLQNINNNAETDDEANKTITVQDPEPENKDMKEKEIKDDEQEQLDADLLFKEKVLGLVGAIVPHNRELSNNLLLTPEFQLFFSQKLLPVLFKIICDSKTNIKVHMTALGVMAKILLCFGPEVGDSAVNHVLELEPDPSLIPGSVTVNFLFSLGAQWLQKSDLDAASCVEGTLESLWTSEKWKSRIIAHASDTLEGLSEESSDPSLISLFSLMFLAGFPDVLRSGTIAILKEVGGETKQVVIDNPSAEQTQVMNFKNRKRLNVKETNIEPIKPIRGVLEHSKIPLLVGIVEKILADHQKGASSFNISVERMWVLGLICKALLRILKDGIDKDAMLSIIRSGVVPGIINLACQGTGFSKQWMLRDLEVLSWKVYKGGDETKKQSSNKEPSCSTGPTEGGEKNDETNSLLVCGTKSPLDGLDEDTKLCMETIHDALHCPYPILRAIYEHNGKNREKLLEEVQRNFDGSTGCNIQASPEILDLAKQWEDEDTTDGTSSSKATPVDSTLDVGILKFQPQKIEFKDLQARPESGENPNKLISSLTEEEINQTMERQQRIKSAELLKKEMESTTRHGNREYTKKVNYAVAVGYARQLVGWLFARWPESEDVMTSMLDNIDPHNIVGLLDLIQATETKKHFNVLVFNFIRCCSKQIIQPLALSAVQCMGEVRLATRVCESDHKYKNNAKIEDKVRISGATSLFIRFDDRCSTEYNCDELVMSSSPRMLENRRAFSGSRDWNDFEMPGDTVYYKFTSDSSNTDWGWKFTVTGGQLGRFETGCSILSALLAQGIQFSRRLPLKQLWSWLIVVACNQVGQQRLMATGLILRILQICAGDPYLFGADAEPFPEQNRPNLSLLRPLWTLYTNAIEADTGTSLSLMSPVIRALSELFLVVENVAQDWGEADDLVAGLATDDKMRRCFTRVVRNIAAIGLAIDLPNKAMDLLKNAKDLPAPPRNPIDDASGSGPSLSRDRKTIELRISDLVSDDDEEDSDDDEDDEDMLFENDDDEDESDGDDDDDDDSGDDDIDWADLAR